MNKRRVCDYYNWASASPARAQKTESIDMKTIPMDFFGAMNSLNILDALSTRGWPSSKPAAGQNQQVRVAPANTALRGYQQRRKLNWMKLEDCECTSLTVQALKNYLVRDALISGLRSDDNRARLLELEPSRADIDSCISLECAIELSSDFSNSFIVEAGSKDSDGFPYCRKLVPVETPTWVLCVQRKVDCRLLN